MNNTAVIKGIATIMRVLSGETRLAIVCFLCSREKACVSEIAKYVGASHSATSHQLYRLEARGIVKSSRDGQRICYEMADSESSKLAKKLIKQCQCL